MAAEVDICNTGLGFIGDDAVVAAINPPDGSIQAAHCARFYPIARDAMLEMHSWRFSTVRVALALSPLDPPVGWAFAYACPSNMVKPRAVLMPNAVPDWYTYSWVANPMNYAPSGVDTLNSQDYIIETSPLDGTPILYTNAEDATLIYSIGVTDTTKFTPLFIIALARLLASYLAGPIIKGKAGTEVSMAQLKIFHEMDMAKAVASDANSQQSNPYTTSTPAPIAARM